MNYHYLSSKLVVRSISKDHLGVFASQPLEAGELISVWGGRITTWDELQSLPPTEQQHSVQVEEEFYLTTPGTGDTADFINHSCEPNCGLRGPITLVALRDIRAEEEISFDYAMTDGSPYDEFDCACGAKNCRKKITGRDWMLPELWVRYEGYFSPYLQRRIERIRVHKS